MWRSRAWPTPAGTWRPERCSSAFPDFAPTATTSRPMPSSGGRLRWWWSGRWASACRRWRCRMCARPWPRWPRASTATPRPSFACAASPGPTARPPPPTWCGTSSRPRASDGPAGHGQVGGGRHRGAGGAHHAGGDRPAGHVPADAGCGRPAAVMEVSSHALELRRADAIHFACAGLHQPDPRAPGLPPDHGGLLRGQEAPLRRARALGGERGRPVRRPAGGRARRRHHLRRRVAGADYRAVDVRFDWSGSSFTCVMPDGELDVATRLPGGFNVLNALGAIAAAGPWPWTPRASRRRWRPPSGCPAGSSRSTRARASACSWTTRTRPTRSTTC